MCVGNDASPRRRHRAAYLAPASRMTTTPFVFSHEGEQLFVPAVETLVITTATHPQHSVLERVTVPLVDTSTDTDDDDDNVQTSTIISCCKSIYQTLIEVLLVMIVMVMSFFLYDVDVSIVKHNHQQQRVDYHVDTERTTAQRVDHVNTDTTTAQLFWARRITNRVVVIQSDQADPIQRRMTTTAGIV